MCQSVPPIGLNTATCVPAPQILGPTHTCSEGIISLSPLWNKYSDVSVSVFPEELYGNGDPTTRKVFVQPMPGRECKEWVGCTHTNRMHWRIYSKRKDQEKVALPLLTLWPGSAPPWDTVKALLCKPSFTQWRSDFESKNNLSFSEDADSVIYVGQSPHRLAHLRCGSILQPTAVHFSRWTKTGNFY